MQIDCYTYVTTARLVADTLRLAQRLPADVAAVVGIARSGLVPAALLSCLLHRPLYAASEERVTPCGAGWRMRDHRRNGSATVLLVDDTICSGRTITQTEPWVQVAFPGSRLLRVILYSTERGEALADVVGAWLPAPHYLDWNLFNSGMLHKAAADMDGILCEEIAVEDDDDGPRYLAALAAARPRQFPRRAPLPAIVTARLERYRPETEAWLRRWQIPYRRLLMGPWETIAERRRRGAVARWKAETYGQLPQSLFIESDARLAREIQRLSGKHVLCPAMERVLT